MRHALHSQFLSRLNDIDLPAVLETIPGGAVIVDALRSEVVLQNRAALSLLGQAAGASPQLRPYLRGARHPDGRGYVFADYPLARALRGSAIVHETLHYRRPDGGEACFLVNARPIRWQEGRPWYVLYHFELLSAQAQAEARLQALQQRLELALDGARLSMWEMDVSTGAITVDERIYALLQIGQDEVAPPTFNTWLTLVHPDDKPQAVANWYHYLQHGCLGASYDAMHRLRMGDGGWKWLAFHARITEQDAAGKPLRVAGTFLDIDALKQAEMSLRDSEGLLRATLHHAAIGLATLTANGRWVRINPKLEEILGYSLAELQKMGRRRLVHPDHQASFEHQLEGLLEGRWPSFTLEQRYLCKNGATIWATLTASAITGEDGRIRWLVYALEDTNAQKQAEQALARAQLQLRMAAQIAGLGFWEWEPDTGYCYFSAEWKALLGYRDEELPSRYEEWEGRLHPEEPWVLERLRQYLRAPEGEYTIEFRMRHRDGSYRWIAARAIPQFDAHGRFHRLVGTHLDITLEKQAREDIRQQAQHDPLTGLPNRGLLQEFGEHILANAKRTGKPLAVLFFDLDRFKAVNDTYGHQAGDAVLCEVARRLRQVRRAEDVTGRLGGDEFLAILPNIHSKEDVVTVALKALEMLRQPYLIDGLALELSPSIGISLYPEDGDSIDALIQQADAAMYAVKQSGCNDFRFAHAPYNHAITALRHPLEHPLQNGLERQEFELYYQPLFNTHSGAVIGAEALVRWKPDGSDVSPTGPATFIPVAEACGLIVSMGEWVLRQACLQHRAWTEQGLPPIPVAVNVSLMQLIQQGFADSVRHAVAGSGMAPEYLELELKAGAVLKNVGQARAVLQELKHAGLKIALDECNLEYLNLRQIGHLPLDRLKFGSSMLHSLSCDKTSIAIANATFAFGRALGTEVAVQGIESEEELQALREYDCELGQGFHLGRPMAAAEFARWYQQRIAH